jgi:hypothetical protein
LITGEDCITDEGDAGWIDCDLLCAETLFLSDGYCDDGTSYPEDLNCEEFGYDGGDCAPPAIDDACTTDSGAEGRIDCALHCSDMTLLGNGLCDDGIDVPEDFDCVEFGYDDGDCMPATIAPWGDNLVVNPGGETGDMTGWTITADGGDGWRAASGGHTGDYDFQTSYSDCNREQEIDLMALGFTEVELDMAPTIVASEWFKEFGEGGDQYNFTVELLGADGSVLSTFTVDSDTGSSPFDTSDDVWFEVAHTFTDYGPGLRRIRIQDGGKDSEFWLGHYGIRIDDASVVVLSP